MELNTVYLLLSKKEIEDLKQEHPNLYFDSIETLQKFYHTTTEYYLGSIHKNPKPEELMLLRIEDITWEKKHSTVYKTIKFLKLCKYWELIIIHENNTCKYSSDERTDNELSRNTFVTVQLDISRLTKIETKEKS